MMIVRVCLFLVISMGCFAQRNIVDVRSSDPVYPVIKRAIKKGYFTLMDNNKFLPNQKVSRKELSLILDRMDSLSNKDRLSSDDIIELKSFAKQFKSYLELQQNQKGIIQSDMGLVKNEQKILNYDLSRVSDQISDIKETQKQKDVFVWISLGLGVFAILK